MDKQKTTQLVLKAQQGNQEALQDLLVSYYERLYYFAYKTTKNEDLAADIIQESCIEIMNSLKNLSDPSAFSTWAHQITYHQCTRHFRAARELQFEENEDGESILDVLPDDREGVLPEQIMEDRELQSILHAMLDALPAEQRSALLLYYYEKLSVKQIAQIHATTEGTVKSRLNYGRKAVKKQVEDYEKKTGTKLHSLAPLPVLLYFLFSQDMAVTASAAAAAAVPTVSSAVSSGASATATKTAGSFISKKLIAVALAATVIAGGVGTVHLIDKSAPQKPSETVISSDAGGNGSADDVPTVHVHQYDTPWAYDIDGHWQVCSCGETTESAVHTYEGRTCTVCSRLLESEGLKYRLNENGTAYHCTGIGTCTDTDLVIPAQYNGLPVTEISSQAFAFNENLTSVVISDGIGYIDDRVFWGCSNIRSIQIPESVYRIRDYAFWKCSALTEITLPSKISEIAPYTFDDCTSLKSIVLPENVTQIGEGAFYKCTALETITIPAGVKSIIGLAFHKCSSLKQIHYGGTVAQWKEFAHASHRVLFGQDWAGISDWETYYTVHCSDGDYTWETHIQ